jgi:hypothetical protein
VSLCKPVSCVVLIPRRASGDFPGLLVGKDDSKKKSLAVAVSHIYEIEERTLSGSEMIIALACHLNHGVRDVIEE